MFYTWRKWFEKKKKKEQTLLLILTVSRDLGWTSGKGTVHFISWKAVFTDSKSGDPV